MLDAIIITKDEEANLPHCLAALQGWTRQVFVVDSGSTDRTGEIAESMGAEFIFHEWPGYAAQKNWALRELDLQAPWTLIVDADEVITPGLRREIEQVISKDPETVPEAGFHLNRLSYFLGKPIRHCGYFPSWNMRLFKRGRAIYENRSVHEHMLLDGPAGYLREPMEHIDRRGIESAIAKHNDYSSLEAHEILAGIRGDTPSPQYRSRLFGNVLERRRWLKQRLYHHLPFPWMLRFVYTYFLRLGLFDGRTGIRFSQFISAYEFLITLKVREAAFDPQPRKEAQAKEPASRDLPVTVVVPVRNEQINLPACLSRLGRFAHVVVVDSGSTDRTLDIAREHGAEVVDFEWNGHFPKKRNWMLHNYRFKTDWVLFLDADEYVSEAFCDELAQTLPDSPHTGMWLTYHNHFMGRYMRYGEPFTKLALFRHDAGEYERIDEDHWSHLDMEVHEHPVLEGTQGRIEAPIDHDDYKSIHSYVRKHNEYSSWEAKRFVKLRRESPEPPAHFTRRQRFKYKALDRWWLAPAYFFKTYLYNRGFLDGYVGFVFASLKWYYFFQIRLKILEIQRAEQDQPASVGLTEAQTSPQ